MLSGHNYFYKSDAKLKEFNKFTSKSIRNFLSMRRISCFFYRTRVRSSVMLVTNSVTHWLTHSLPFSKLDWCEPGIWRWQLKTCWSCLSRLESNSLTFLQLVKDVKTLTGGATGSVFYFDFACTTNFPFPFLMAPVEKYMRWAYLVNHIIYGKLFTRAISFRPENIEYTFTW